MKAGVYLSPGRLGVREVSDPVLEAGEVMIAVKAAGICGSDLHGYRDLSRFERMTDRVMGHELAGEVVAVGNGVKDRRVGERVAIEPLMSCGRCGWCREGNYHLCPELAHVGFAWSGGFAELSKAPAEKAFALPDDVSYEAAAVLDCVACGVHAMHRVGVRMGESVVVLGGGAIGFSVVECAKWSGARFVALSDPVPRIREVAESIGVDMTIDPSLGDPAAEVVAATGGTGADVVIEAVGGRAPTLKQAVDMVRRGGRIGYLGSFTAPQELDMGKILRREITIVPVWSYARWGPISEYQIALDGVALGRVNAEAMVTHRFPLDRIDEAFQAAANKETSGAVKVIVNP